MPQAGAGRPDHREADERQPPRQAERRHQGERRQRGQRRLDGEDRKLRGDQRRHLRTDGRGRAPQRGDPRGDPQLPVEHAAQDLHARRAIEDAAVDRPAGRLDGQMPRLAAREQRDDLQQHGHGEHPRRGVGERGRELVAAPGEQEREDRRGGQRAHDRDQRASAATEVAEAGSQFGQPTRAPRSRRRADRFATRDRHRRFRSAHRGSPSKRRYRAAGRLSGRSIANAVGEQAPSPLASMRAGQLTAWRPKERRRLRRNFPPGR